MIWCTSSYIIFSVTICQLTSRAEGNNDSEMLPHKVQVMAVSHRILIYRMIRKSYCTRVGFKIVYSSHSCEYAVNHSYSGEASRYVATYLSKDDNKAHLLEISTLPTPEKKNSLLSKEWRGVSIPKKMLRTTSAVCTKSPSSAGEQGRREGNLNSRKQVIYLKDNLTHYPPMY